MASNHLRRYLIVGLLTATPLLITWLVIDFVAGQLSRFGRPGVIALARLTERAAPAFSEWLLGSGFQYLLSVAFALGLILLLGWFSSRVLGRRLIALFEELMSRIPIIQTLYGGTRKFLAAVQQQPQGQRVVLIDFPNEGMKALGFVTRTLRDANTGEELVAVYVPTTPNPTSGYLEVLPASQVTPTDWTVDQAMAFIITGGTSAPDTLSFRRPPASPPGE